MIPVFWSHSVNPRGSFSHLAKAAWTKCLATWCEQAGTKATSGEPAGVLALIISTKYSLLQDKNLQYGTLGQIRFVIKL